MRKKNQPTSLHREKTSPVERHGGETRRGRWPLPQATSQQQGADDDNRPKPTRTATRNPLKRAGESRTGPASVGSGNGSALVHHSNVPGQPRDRKSGDRDDMVAKLGEMSRTLHAGRRPSRGSGSGQALRIVRAGFMPDVCPGELHTPTLRVRGENSGERKCGVRRPKTGFTRVVEVDSQGLLPKFPVSYSAITVDDSVGLDRLSAGHPIIIPFQRRPSGSDGPRRAPPSQQSLTIPF
ncbi:hypothetical protein N7462_000044 [Penicillium macrosclerotiorum]|uniref:uncharacterized protein n=1 Tax=Penicillium macrosclerotiorum TaxID=303699 RepID=UPI0025499539|nr:uncharacterized protein N7462_000044 [Penicillium macrosclerotiorum]KAJ5698039.1 hypothetical protein N7462_000044 [Penicillium macrosclerotiorum]